MGTRLFIKGGKADPIDLPRGAIAPHDGDVVDLKLRGDQKSKKYTVYLVEHFIDLNQAVPIGRTEVVLELLRTKKKGD